MARQPLTFGIPVGQMNYETALAHARAADAAGFRHVSVNDRPHDPFLDGWILATHLAAQTSQVRFYHSTLNVPFRYPATVAKEASTFDIVSGGRFDLCLGAGGESNRPLYESVGVPLPERPGERLGRLRETIEICRGLWSNERFSYEGRYYRLTDVVGDPRPLQQPIPVWIGAGQPRSLQLAGSLADGFVKNGGFGSVEELRDLRRQANQAAEAAGRDPDGLRVLMQCACYLAESAADLEAYRSGGPASVANVPSYQLQGLSGTRDQLLEQIAEYRRAGVDTFVFRFPLASAVEQIGRFGSEVLPEASKL